MLFYFLLNLPSRSLHIVRRFVAVQLFASLHGRHGSVTDAVGLQTRNIDFLWWSDVSPLLKYRDS
jgi:hypothetical protein